MLTLGIAGSPKVGGISASIASVADAAASVLSDASQTVVAAAGGTPSPTDLSQSISSFVAKVTDSVQQPAIIDGAADALSSAAGAAGSVYGDASQTVLAALGGTPSPTDLSQSAASVYARAADSLPKSVGGESLADALSSASAAAASVLGEASQTVIAAVGGAQSPTDLSQTISSLYAQATDALPKSVNADPIVDTFAAGTDGAASILAEASQSVISALGGTPSPPDLAQSASSLYAKATDSLPDAGGIRDSLAEGQAAAAAAFGEASQTLVSAVGGTPSPTNLAQSAASVLTAATDSIPGVGLPNVEGAASSISASAASVYADLGDAAHSATRSAKVAAGATPPAENAGEALENAQLAASSIYARATQAVVDSIPDGSSLSSAAASVYSSVADAVPKAPSVPEAVASARDSAASLGGAVSQSVISAAGGNISPTDWSQTLSASAAAASKSTDEALSRAGDAAQAAARAVRQRIEL